MGRQARHPQALRDRLHKESKRPNPWRPQLTYRIVLYRRDGTRDFPALRSSTLEEARAEVQRRFDFDIDDVYEKAWIREVVRC
jgi:hypothetical protein